MHKVRKYLQIGEPACLFCFPQGNKNGGGHDTRRRRLSVAPSGNCGVPGEFPGHARTALRQSVGRHECPGEELLQGLGVVGGDEIHSPCDAGHHVLHRVDRPYVRDHAVGMCLLDPSRIARISREAVVDTPMPSCRTAAGARSPFRYCTMAPGRALTMRLQVV